MLEWLKTQMAGWAVKGATATIAGIATFIAQFEGVFIIVAMAGVFLIIAGCKRWGTNLTSLSILIFLIVEVLSKC